MIAGRKRHRLQFSGIVQGVGFRPFIYRLAVGHRLSGFVQNRPDGVIVEIEGYDQDIAAFSHAVTVAPPPRAEVSAIAGVEIPVRGDPLFRIVASGTEGLPQGHIPADSATCPECLAELFSPSDRRYRYPFINCTNCGPRLTIISDLPYDRARTSMSPFPLCPACLAEYRNPADRRFHAEPNACPVCGPRLTLLDADGRIRAVDDPLQEAVAILRRGEILAVKGLGGFHLAVDAANDEAVKRLRLRKYREEKPLAVMVRDPQTASSFVAVTDPEKLLLLSPRSPIVLIQKIPGAKGLSPAVAPGMANLGIMLPYTPLHHLLLRDHFRALVMTSGNRTDEPVCIDNQEAVERLQGIADFFLVHDREILVRCDDSIATVVAGGTSVLRRSRGYVPLPIPLNKRFPPVLALGPQMKSTLCILKGNLAFLSPHIGDLETPQARDFLHVTRAFMERITECRPAALACDLHPDYYTTRLARQILNGSAPPPALFPVQHHHAHVVSCMAENGLTGEVIGLAMDGSGYGTDGHVWGGEFLVADERSFSRMGHLKEFPLPGGEKAIREPWRIAIALLREAYGPAWQERAEKLRLIPGTTNVALLERMMDRGINSPTTSSLGRFLDGVAAILGARRTVTFEGQAAMELEGMAREGGQELLPFTMIKDATILLDLAPAVRTLVELRLSGTPLGASIFALHRTITRAFREMAVAIRERTGLNRVALSGGCFQNRILLEGALREMGDAGFQPFHHHLVPTNDGGLSLGQAVCAASLMQAEGATRPIIPLASPEAEASAPLTEAMNDHEQ